MEVELRAHRNQNPLESEIFASHSVGSCCAPNGHSVVLSNFLRCLTASFSVHFLNAGRMPKFGKGNCFVFVSWLFDAAPFLYRCGNAFQCGTEFHAVAAPTGFFSRSS
jgi:hypothetical protein